jgi:hypothetical protein
MAEAPGVVTGLALEVTEKVTAVAMAEVMVVRAEPLVGALVVPLDTVMAMGAATAVVTGPAMEVAVEMAMAMGAAIEVVMGPAMEVAVEMAMAMGAAMEVVIVEATEAATDTAMEMPVGTAEEMVGAAEEATDTAIESRHITWSGRVRTAVAVSAILP